MWMLYTTFAMITLITTGLVSQTEYRGFHNTQLEESVARQMVAYVNAGIAECKVAACPAGVVDPSPKLNSFEATLLDGRFVTYSDGAGNLATVYVSGVGQLEATDGDVVAGMRSINVNSTGMGYWSGNLLVTAAQSGGGGIIKRPLAQGFGGHTFHVGEPVMVSW